MRTIVLTAVFATVAATASAQEIMLPDDDFVSKRTRAEVMAAIPLAQAQGLMQQKGEITWVAPTVDIRDRDRAAIRDEARHAQSANDLNTVYGPRYQN